MSKQISTVFYNLENYDSYLTFQELEKHNFKIIVTPKTKEKYMSFTIKQLNNNSIKIGLPLNFIDSVYFLNNSLHNIVKNLGKNDFNNLSQDFNANALDLAIGIA